MKKIKIQIVKLGKQKYNYVFDKLKKYKSKIFEVTIYEVSRPDCDYEWGYTFGTLEKILDKAFDRKNYDICIGFVDTIIENNYFGKRLKDYNVYIVSFYQVSDFLIFEKIDIFNYVLATIYRYITRFLLKGKYLTHDETKGCIFDMCGDKRDIIYSCQMPIICEHCKAKMKESACPSDFIELLSKEILKIKKPLYYQITDFIKSHPYLSLGIGIVFSVLFNILSSFLYDWIKVIFG